MNVGVPPADFDQLLPWWGVEVSQTLQASILCWQNSKAWSSWAFRWVATLFVDAFLQSKAGPPVPPVQNRRPWTYRRRGCCCSCARPRVATTAPNLAALLLGGFRLPARRGGSCLPEGIVVQRCAAGLGRTCRQARVVAFALWWAWFAIRGGHALGDTLGFLGTPHAPAASSPRNRGGAIGPGLVAATATRPSPALRCSFPALRIEFAVAADRNGPGINRSPCSPPSELDTVCAWPALSWTRY